MLERDCLDDDQVAAFVAGSVDATERAAIELHASACSSCRRVISETVKGLGSDDAPQRPSSRELAPLKKGDTLGRYEIVDLAGAGAMGLVYVARDAALSRDIALKVLRTTSDAHYDQLATEAKLMAQLSHPNVVAVYDVGVARDQMYLAMELVGGETLTHWLDTPRTWHEVRRVFVQAGRALAAAHAAGIVHRDFKPQNVLVGVDGRVRVTDFGLASSGDRREGMLVGTPAYMAPDQLAGRPADAASDQYSFCVALYEALFGKRPFAAPGLDELRVAIARGVQFPPRPRVPGWLARIVARGLSDEPARRYPSMHALVRDLARRRVGKPIAIGVAAIALTGIAGGVAIHRAATAEHCDVHMPPWDVTRARVALLATNRPYAEATFERVKRQLDAYTARWDTLANESCRAGRLAERRGCLEDRRIELATFVEQLTRVDSDSIVDVIEAAAQLAPIESCAGDAQPATTANPVHVAMVRTLVAQARVFAVTRPKETKSIVERALAATATLGMPSLAAQARLADCEAEIRLQHAKLAETACLAASTDADSVGYDALKVRALADLIHVVGIMQHRHADAHVFVQLAHGALARVPNADGVLLPALLQYEGRLAMDEGQPADALAAFERSARLFDASVGPGDPRSIAAAIQFARALQSDDKLEAALEITNRLLPLHRTTFGDRHPVTARAYYVHALIERDLGRHEDALAHLRIVLEIQEAVSPDSLAVGATLNAIATTYGLMGNAKEAVALFLRSLAIAEKHEGPRSVAAGARHVNLAAAYLLLDDTAAAERHGKAALEILVERVGADHPDVAAVRTSLAEIHRRRGEWRAALEQDQAALAALEARLGKTHPDIGAPLLGIGLSYLELGKPELARAPLERALSLDQRADRVGEARIRLALARARSPVDVALAREARALLADEPPSNQEAREMLETIDKWIAAH